LRLKSDKHPGSDTDKPPDADPDTHSRAVAMLGSDFERLKRLLVI
jgi:hypothetical protein